MTGHEELRKKISDATEKVSIDLLICEMHLSNGRTKVSHEYLAAATDTLLELMEEFP